MNITFLFGNIINEIEKIYNKNEHVNFAYEALSYIIQIDSN